MIFRNSRRKQALKKIQTTFLKRAGLNDFLNRKLHLRNTKNCFFGRKTFPGSIHMYAVKKQVNTAITRNIRRTALRN